MSPRKTLYSVRAEEGCRAERPAAASLHSRERLDAAYAIVLTRDARRRRHMERQLARERLNAEIVPAVDGAELTWPKLEEWGCCGYLDPALGLELRVGQIGCCLSHLLVLEEIARRDYERALILEDDCLLCENFAERLRFALSRAPAGWDILYLFNNRETKRLRVPGEEHVRKPVFPMGAAAYVVSSAGARRILGLCKPAYDVLNMMYADQVDRGRLAAYVVHPTLVRDGCKLGSNISTTAKLPSPPHRRPRLRAQEAEDLRARTGLDAAHAIVLERDAKRRRHVARQLGRAWLEAEIVPAVDGAELTWGEVEHWERRGYLAPNLALELLRGQIGCSLSHLLLLERIARRNQERALVLEDDFVLDEDFGTRLRTALSRVPAGWDLVYLFNYRANRRLRVPGEAHVRRPVYPMGTVAYVVSSASARKILRLCKPAYSAIDVMYAEQIDAGELVAYVVHPTLVRCRSALTSNISTTDTLSLPEAPQP